LNHRQEFRHTLVLMLAVISSECQRRAEFAGRKLASSPDKCTHDTDSVCLIKD